MTDEYWLDAGVLTGGIIVGPGLGVGLGNIALLSFTTVGVGAGARIGFWYSPMIGRLVPIAGRLPPVGCSRVFLFLSNARYAGGRCS